MHISNLLKLQVLYMIIGVGYNIVSLIMISSGGRALSTTLPTLGITTLLVYGLTLLFGYYGYYKVYRIFMLVAIIGFGYAGILLHIVKYSDLHLYYSFTAWFLAIMINVVGAAFNLIALTGKFKTNEPT